MSIFLIVVHILACIALIAIVLLQHGKGADIGAAFGAGASNTVFGARGAGNFLTKLTTGTVVVFMLTSITLSYFGAPRTVTDILSETASEAPAEPPPAVVPEPLEAEPIPEGDVPSGFEAIPPPQTEE